MSRIFKFLVEYEKSGCSDFTIDWIDRAIVKFGEMANDKILLLEDRAFDSDKLYEVENILEVLSPLCIHDRNFFLSIYGQFTIIDYIINNNRVLLEQANKAIKKGNLDEYLNTLSNEDRNRLVREFL